MKLEPVVIPYDSGSLSGLRYHPVRTPRDIALIFAHGFTSGKYSMDNLAGYLAGRGFAGLTFDFPGHKLGASGGTMTRTEQAGESLREVLHWFRQETTARRLVLVGHSMGAAASLWVAAEEAANAVSVSPASDFPLSGGAALSPDRAASPAARLAGIVCLCMGLDPARGFESAIGKAMLAQRQDYVAGAPPLELLHGLNRLLVAAERLDGLAALFVAARQDVLVSVARVEELAARVGAGATLSVIESSHLEAPDRARAAVAEWLEQLA